MTDRTPDWTPEQTAELTPLARVIDRAIRNAPVLLAEGPAALVPHVTVAVAAYMGGIVGPVPATPESPTTDTTARDELHQAARWGQTESRSADAMIDAYRDEVLRHAASEIRAVAEAKGWSLWAASFINPDVEFVDAGMPSIESIVSELRKADRAAVLRQAADALDTAKGQHGSGTYDYETGPGMAKAAALLRRMADEGAQQ